MHLLKRLYRDYNEIINYIIFGLMTTVVSIVSFIVINSFDISYLYANAISILLSVLFAFYVNKKYVFKSPSQLFSVILKEFLLFALFRGFSFIVDMTLMLYLVEKVLLNPTIAKFFTEIIIIIINFIASKFFVFKK